MIARAVARKGNAMSLNVHEIQLSGKPVTLRLTSKALLNYNLKHGVEGNSPAVAVLNAIGDYQARADLFTNALNHPDNRNEVKDGCTLQDLLADNSWDRDAVNQLILDLAVEAGLLKPEEGTTLYDCAAANGAKVVNTLGKLLRGDKIDAAADQNGSASSEDENPT